MSYNTDEHAVAYSERPDLSPFLVHLTRRSERRSAYQNLLNILKTGRILGSDHSGFIRGPNKAACFMDIPLGNLKYILNESNRKRYEPYGVVLSKGWAYEKGCRPVLYLSRDECDDDIGVPRSQLWRVVRFDGVMAEEINWTHEREWRVKGSFQLPSKLRAVLVKDTIAARRLANAIADDEDEFEALPATIIPLTVLCQGLPYLK